MLLDAALMFLDAAPMLLDGETVREPGAENGKRNQPPKQNARREAGHRSKQVS
jgi:hypothetical protein